MLDEATKKYRTDATFHTLVDCLRMILRQQPTTPSELREALLFAAYIEEMENPTPAWIRVRDLSQDIDAELEATRRAVSRGAETKSAVWTAEEIAEAKLRADGYRDVFPDAETKAAPPLAVPVEFARAMSAARPAPSAPVEPETFAQLGAQVFNSMSSRTLGGDELRAARMASADTASAPVEPPMCKPGCGEHCLSADGYVCWPSVAHKTCFCSRGCRDAGRPLRPALPEVPCEACGKAKLHPFEGRACPRHPEGSVKP